MATRFFLESTGTPALLPTAWGAGWDYQNGTVDTWNATTAVATTTLTNLTHTNDATGTARFGSRARFVSLPLAAQTIDGTLTGQLQASENNNNNNATIAIAVRVIDQTGLIVATLLAVSASDDTAAAPPELTTTLTNRQVQDAAEATTLTLSSYVCKDGDRVVIEIGVREVRNTGTEVIRVGTDAASGDLPVDNTTTTTTFRPWVELSDTLTFKTVPVNAPFDVSGVMQYAHRPTTLQTGGVKPACAPGPEQIV